MSETEQRDTENHSSEPIGAKTNSIQQIRYVCSIAAMYSASAIPGVIPITHCGPGCADKQFMNLATYYRYLEDFSDFYSEYWWGLPAKFVVVGDSGYNLALTKFLVNQLGIIPGKQIITENPPEEYRDDIRSYYHSIAEDVSTDVEFEEDSYRIHRLIRGTDYGQKAPVIFGTTWERDLAKELKTGIVEVGFPASYEVVLSRSYLGYRGALTLLEKIYTTAVSASA